MSANETKALASRIEDVPELLVEINIAVGKPVKGTNKARIEIPITDGSTYTVRILLLDAKGSVISYADHIGVLNDNHADVYEGTATLNGSKVKLSGPTSNDWWHLYAWQDGKQITFKNGRQFAIRGVDDLTSLTVEGGSGVIKVVLEDFSGKMSEPVEVPFGTTYTSMEK